MTANHVHGDSTSDREEHQPLENPFRTDRSHRHKHMISSMFSRSSASASPIHTASPRRTRTYRSNNTLTTLVGGLILILAAFNFYLLTLIVPDISQPLTSVGNIMKSRFTNSSDGNGVINDDMYSDTDTLSHNVTDETMASIITELKSYPDTLIAWRRTEMKQVKLRRQLRNRQRRDRISPSSIMLSEEGLVNGLGDNVHHRPNIDVSIQNLFPTYEDTYNESRSMDTIDFCGIHAKNASRMYPTHYKHYHSLNNNSKVLITGILSPIGFHLALKLATECNVQVMLAVDPIYPNHFIHRLRAQQYIAILTKMIPKLQMPIVIPFVGLDRRTPPQDSSRKRIFFHTTGEINYSFFKVTHIIHLASSDPYLYRDFLDDKYQERYHYDHTYVTEDRIPGHLLGFRQSLVGMEQLLMGLSNPVEDVDKGKIQMTYITTSTLKNEYNDPRRKEDYDFFTTAKVMDELMAKLYCKLKQISSVSVRLPTVYGPHGRHGSFMYELAEKASKHWDTINGSKQTYHADGTNHTSSSVNQSYLLDMIGYKGSADMDMKDLLFIDDAVDAILAAMQLTVAFLTATTTTLDVSSGHLVALKDIAAFIESQMAVHSIEANTRDVMYPSKVIYSEVLQKSSNITNTWIQWSPVTTLENGLRLLLSWHLDKNIPYGSFSDLYDLKPNNSSVGMRKENGKDFLTRNKIELCAPDDLYCLRGEVIYPCMSECASLKQCKASPYDDVKDIAWSFSSGCHTVVYILFLGIKLNDINHTAPTLIGNG